MERKRSALGRCYCEYEVIVVDDESRNGIRSPGTELNLTPENLITKG